MTARALCARCRRPEPVCYCTHLSTIPSATRVVVLQHPREEDRPIGTAHMASLCLPNSELHVGLAFDDTPLMARLLSDPQRKAVLLYPGEGALDIVAHPPKEPLTMIVVDGTWAQAKKLVKLNPRLAALPRVSFVPPTPSEYRIRREPKDTYLSTLESLVLVLGALEGDPHKFAPMLAPFRAMIDRQLDCEETFQGSRTRKRRKVKRPERSSLPDALTSSAHTRVCVSGEANAWAYASPERKREGYRDEVVVWTALRLETGESFQMIAAPVGAPSVGTPFHAEISMDSMINGATRSELLSAWSAFVRPTDVLCSWGHHAPALFLHEGANLPDARVDVRSLARILEHGAVGTLEDHAARLGEHSTTPHLGFEQGLEQGFGRAARRLELLTRITRHIITTDPSPKRC